MRIRYLPAVLLVSFCMTGAVNTALAQYTTGTIAGTVTDSTGAVLPGVAVTLRSEESGQARSLTTGQAGEYVFPALPPGRYDLTLIATGFEQTKAVVTAVSSETVSQSFALRPGAQTTTIEVDAAASNLSITSPELQTSRSSVELSQLPASTRSPSDLATLEPGVTPVYLRGGGALVAVSGAQTGLISAYGSRARATAASLDYTDITDWEFGGIALGTQPNVDMISEFNTITGPFEAEYGVEAANIVEVTKSGTNHLHGTAYDYVENDYFNARSYFDTTGKPTPLKQNNYGLNAGGPLWRNRTFLFGGFQKISTRGAGSTFTFPVPTAAALAGATDTLALQLFQKNVPLPSNAPAAAAGANITETMSSPNDSYFYLLRGDHHFSGNHSLSIRYLFNKGTAVLPYAGTVNFLPGFGADFDTGAHSVNISDTYLYGSNRVNELRIAYGRSSAQFNAQDTTGIPRIDFLNAYYSFGEAQFFPQGRLFNTYQVSDTFSWIHGRHALKFGADIRYIQDNSSSTTSGGIRGTFAFDSIESYLAGQPVSWSRVFGATYEGYRMGVPGFFAQDEWKALPGLTINYGLRYEVQGALNEVHGLISELDTALQGVTVGAAGTGPLGAFRSGNPGIAANYGNVSPRIGFAWSPGNHRLLVRGGYGVYFDTHNFALLANTRFGPPLNYTVSLAQFTGGNSFDNIVNGTAPIVSDTSAQIGSFGSLANFGSIVSVTKHLPNPYTQNYMLGVQYQLARRTALSADYLGSVSRKLTDLGPINSVAAPPPAPKSLAEEAACIGTTTSPGPCAATVAQEYGPGNNRIDPRFDQVDQLAADGGSNFNGLVLQWKQNAVYGLQAQASYTWSRSLDDDSDYNLAQISNEESFPQGQAAALHKLEYGPSDFDITNRFLLTTVWQLPWYKNQLGLIGHLLGGWTLSTINSWQSGAPATLYSGSRLGPPDPSTGKQIAISDVNLDGNLVQTTGSDNTRATLNPGGKGFKFGSPSTIPAPQDRGVGGLPADTNSSGFRYVQTLVGNIGTIGRNTFRMNMLPTIDWSLAKDTRFLESGLLGSGPWSFELRADAFNVFNIPFLTATGYETWNNLANASFGLYNTAGSSRWLQLTAKISF
ncbi:TonB-dependent receptor [Paracidobacterium acidisoli]|uniref:TonB-dependent receptor n=1 Tax=Paracidobacterium acidisoli TaxID=2303751 RepID=A0A372IK91_9BACT|nr:carboxypeptidase regulatory-like domain-containing protein [Paracidobacterium acidisoli]MBT9332696.1 carboxypeptidase regulatory-like domain-containing protein [Paracidobacterium acidisoli]